MLVIGSSKTSAPPFAPDTSRASSFVTATAPVAALLADQKEPVEPQHVADPGLVAVGRSEADRRLRARRGLLFHARDGHEHSRFVDAGAAGEMPKARRSSAPIDHVGSTDFIMTCDLTSSSLACFLVWPTSPRSQTALERASFVQLLHLQFLGCLEKGV